MNKHKRYSSLLLAALAEGEGGNGAGSGGDTAAGDTSAKGDSSAKNDATDTGTQDASQSKSGQRDAAADEPKNGDQQPKSTGDTSRLEKALEKERELRKAAEKSATDNKAATDAAEKARQDQLDAIAVALGVKKGDAPPDPEALQRAVAERDAKLTDAHAEKDREVASRDDTIRQQCVELAAWRLGSDPKLGANVAALLDSRRVAESIASMDPASDSFEKDLSTVLKAAVDGNDAYRAARATSSAADAGIGAAGAKSDAPVAPGAGRLRAAYSGT